MNAPGQLTCPLCGKTVDQLIYGFHRAEEDAVLRQIQQRHPKWAENDGACSRCIDYYHLEVLLEQKIMPEIGPHFPVRTVDDYVVIPTPLRMGAVPRYTGRGVTICMIDSSFYPHPDLVRQRRRILKIADLTNPSQPAEYFRHPHPESWHGTMTSVVCAGNGYLSRGLYRGIASQSNLVLLKTQGRDGISGDTIAAAIRWAIKHRDEFNIRVINLSVTDDLATSYHANAVDQAAEDATKAGIVVVAAAGNDPRQPVRAPANSPNVITVGGLNDHNTLGFDTTTPYHSTHGFTADAFLKPEVIAPAIWVAAPILPGTAEQAEAQALFAIMNAGIANFQGCLKRELPKTALSRKWLGEKSRKRISEAVRQRISEAKYISPHYQHADGTSFAAPIVTSLIAQMLEANPGLTPALVREFLFKTARMLPHIPSIRQGYGLVNAGAALQIAQREKHHFSIVEQVSPQIDYRGNAITFYYHDHNARSIRLAGDFNNWATDGPRFHRTSNGSWNCQIPLLPKGSYAYKFILDDNRWINDPRNHHREPDHFNGFNNRLFVK